MCELSKPPDALRSTRSAIVSSRSSRNFLTKGRPVRAVQVGGPLGAYFPEKLLDTPLDYEAFAAKKGLDALMPDGPKIAPPPQASKSPDAGDLAKQMAGTGQAGGSPGVGSCRDLAVGGIVRTATAYSRP